jgi:hypothetical protein
MPIIQGILAWIVVMCIKRDVDEIKRNAQMTDEQKRQANKSESWVESLLKNQDK